MKNVKQNARLLLKKARITTLSDEALRHIAGAGYSISISIGTCLPNTHPMRCASGERTHCCASYIP